MVVPRQRRRERSYLEGTGATEDAASGRAARAEDLSGVSSSPPTRLGGPGALAQLGERRLCKPEVTGSIPVRSTTSQRRFRAAARFTEETRFPPCAPSSRSRAAR